MNISEILKLTQKELASKLITALNENGYKDNMLVTDKYIFAKGEIPIMLVAHMDTVHLTPVKELFYDKEKDVLWSPEGVGGDDRCGVYAILSLIKRRFKTIYTIYYR